MSKDVIDSAETVIANNIRRESLKTYKQLHSKAQPPAKPSQEIIKEIVSHKNGGHDWWVYPCYSKSQKDFNVDRETELGKNIYAILSKNKEYVKRYVNSIKAYLYCCRLGKPIYKDHSIRLHKIIQSLIGMTNENKEVMAGLNIYEQYELLKEVYDFAEETQQIPSPGKNYYKDYEDLKFFVREDIYRMERYFKPIPSKGYREIKDFSKLQPQQGVGLIIARAENEEELNPENKKSEKIRVALGFKDLAAAKAILRKDEHYDISDEEILTNVQRNIAYEAGKKLITFFEKKTGGIFDLIKPQLSSGNFAGSHAANAIRRIIEIAWMVTVNNDGLSSVNKKAKAKEMFQEQLERERRFLPIEYRTINADEVFSIASKFSRLFQISAEELGVYSGRQINSKKDKAVGLRLKRTDLKHVIYGVDVAFAAINLPPEISNKFFIPKPDPHKANHTTPLSTSNSQLKL